jgi:hypothetical protein
MCHATSTFHLTSLAVQCCDMLCCAVFCSACNTRSCWVPVIQATFNLTSNTVLPCHAVLCCALLDCNTRSCWAPVIPTTCTQTLSGYSSSWKGQHHPRWLSSSTHVTQQVRVAEWHVS